MTDYFNYIVPIFNKEDVLPQTLDGIERCSGPRSKIFLIVDGCTDKSESIVDDYIKGTSKYVEKILMPNVHMLLSVNEGLKRVTGGFTIVTQDDIVMQDPDMERRINELYSERKNLGVISFRYGADLRGLNRLSSLRNIIASGLIKKYDFNKYHLLTQKLVETYNLIQSPDDNADFERKEYNTFYQRMCAINGPNVIPYSLLSKIGFLDENIAPYGYDDPDYCIRALKSGYINGLFPIKYVSEDGWSGSSRSEAFKRNANRIIIKSRLYVYQKHKDFFKNLST